MFANFLGEWIFRHYKPCVKCERYVSVKTKLVIVNQLDLIITAKPSGQKAFTVFVFIKLLIPIGTQNLTENRTYQTAIVLN